MSTTLSINILPQVQEHTAFKASGSRFNEFFASRHRLSSPTQTQFSGSISSSSTPSESPSFNPFDFDTPTFDSSPWNTQLETDAVAAERSSATAGLFGFVGGSACAFITHLKQMLRQTKAETAQVKSERDEVLAEAAALKAQLDADSAAIAALESENAHWTQHNASLEAKIHREEQLYRRMERDQVRQNDKYWAALDAEEVAHWGRVQREAGVRVAAYAQQNEAIGEEIRRVWGEMTQLKGKQE